MANLAIKLEEVLPEKAEFYLEKKKKTYHIRPFQLVDVVWIQKTFGKGDALGQIFTDMDWGAIVRVIYHQLVEKEDFLLTTIEEIDDMGRKATVEVSGPELLLKTLGGAEEGMKMISAVSRALMDSNPNIKEYVEDSLKKKKVIMTRAGAKSSTRLRRNTATPLRK